MSTNQSRHIPVWRRRMDAAIAKAAEWQQKIDNAPADTSSHQLGVWRGRVRDCQKRARAYQEKIERHQ